MITQTPREEIAEKVAEATGLAVAARAVALEDQRRMLHDHTNRVRDGHRAQAKAAGMEETVKGADELKDDEMGDIIVAGDTHVEMPQSQPIVPPPAAQKNELPAWAKYAAAAALGAGGLLGYNALTDDAPPAAVTDQPVAAEPGTDRWMEYTIEKWTPEPPE